MGILLYVPGRVRYWNKQKMGEQRESDIIQTFFKTEVNPVERVGL